MTLADEERGVMRWDTKAHGPDFPYRMGMLQAQALGTPRYTISGEIFPISQGDSPCRGLAKRLISPAAMPSITNVGGSLTSAIALTLIAWAVRFVRARNSRKQDEKDLHRQLGRYHASLSAAALLLMVSHHVLGLHVLLRYPALCCDRFRQIPYPIW